MKQASLKLLITSLLILAHCITYGQGCSDAGFCTINSFQPNNSANISEFNNQIKFGLTFGGADQSISILGNYLEYSRQLKDKFVVHAKITSLSQSGNDISTFGLSDIYLNSDYKANKNLKLSAGIKIPLTNGNTEKDNLPLPMDYQSSLGTLDIVLGIAYEIKKIQFVAGFQQPLTQNKNAFTAENYPQNSKLREFQSTNNYKRSGDILLRVSYPIKLGQKFMLTPSLLPIYHIANDKYTDLQNIERDIEGSQGLTLNGNVYFDFNLSRKHALQLNAGMPFVVRDARPDGLTRGFVVNLEYNYKF